MAAVIASRARTVVVRGRALSGALVNCGSFMRVRPKAADLWGYTIRGRCGQTWKDFLLVLKVIGSLSACGFAVIPATTAKPQADLRMTFGWRRFFCFNPASP